MLKQAQTNNVNKTWALLQTSGGKDEQNIVLCGNRNGTQSAKTHNRITQKYKKMSQMLYDI